MSTPLVSVIIPTYQRAHLVGEAIQSVLAQSYTRYEIIVVNDGSTDHTREVLAAFGPSIQVIHQPNQGLSAARNAGLRSASGSYIALLDDDDIWLPHKLAQQVEVITQHPRVGLVYADMFGFNETGVLPSTYAESIPPPPVQQPTTLFFQNFIPGPTIFMRRDCVEELGGYDETLTACEDYDLSLRLLEKWPVYGLAEPLAYYRLSPDSMQRDAERMHLNLLRVKEQAFQRNAAIRQLPLKLLDRYFYSFYLGLARLYLSRRQSKLARMVLSRYRRGRGRTPAYLQLWWASRLPFVASTRLRALD